ncbi:hypothetical protein ACFQ0M_45900 [Kitasatospora aburaviensis]|uniref:Lipoprotein n=1 Tax=Kitasatospora aburaviensis TaxID=67265 RepID=A0ABW1F5W2_9ACTN
MAGRMRARRRVRVLAALFVVSVLPLAASCAVVVEEGDAPMVGPGRSSAGSIQFLDGGVLGEVSLPSAACGGRVSPGAVAFTGTWRHGKMDDAGHGAHVQLASVAGELKCERYFQFFTYQGQERLQLTGTAGMNELFVRQ